MQKSTSYSPCRFFRISPYFIRPTDRLPPHRLTPSRYGSARHFLVVNLPWSTHIYGPKLRDIPWPTLVQLQGRLSPWIWELSPSHVSWLAFSASEGRWAWIAKWSSGGRTFFPKCLFDIILPVNISRLSDEYWINTYKLYHQHYLTKTNRIKQCDWTRILTSREVVDLRLAGICEVND